MCGIAGFVNFGSGGPGPETATRMISMIQHRGPDESGCYHDACASLAHARLSIIDIGGGRQPMHNEDRTLWIVFNGEIFNYLELRERLLENGHTFQSRSDTEVILHLYEEQGEDCVHQLNGQWAFAIWDSRRRVLFVSRDRVGVRPVFYAATPRGLVFASEVKALFAHPEVSRELDPLGVDEIFTFWVTLPPRTVFRGVLELPPGHSMTVTDGQLDVKRYWQPEYGGRSGADPRSEQDYAQELRELLIDAVRIRLRADVPVGAYLSGGLDSTVTAAMILRFTAARLRTFSVAFDDPDFDESSYQREAVRYLGTDHSELRCGSADIGRAFPDVVWHAEKPMLRTAPVPLFLLSRAVREAGYKVVVTGEGADEMLGGYDIFKEAKIRRFWMAQPNSVLRPLLLRRLYPYLKNVQAQPESYLRSFFQVRPGQPPGPLFSHLPRWELTARAKIFFSGPLRSELSRRNLLMEMEEQLPGAYAQWHPFSQAQYLEAAYLLPGYILSSQGDRVAMAHSVEGRYPFLDHRVVQFASRLPASLKMKVLNEKYLLKRCAEGLIPPSVQQRAKQPYRAPEGAALMSSEAREYMGELLSARQLRRDGIFDAASVARLVDKFQSGRAIGIKDNMALCGIVSTQLLLDQFINHFTRRSDLHADQPRTTTICD